MVGFNRRFAPLFTDLRERFGRSSSPLAARYLVNAGRLDAGSWYLDEEREDRGSPVRVGIHRHPERAGGVGPGRGVRRGHRRRRARHAAVRQRVGGQIAYLTDGSTRFPKETLDVTGDGRNGRLDNFSRVTVWSAKGRSGHRVLAGQDKGQQAQLKRFVDAVRTGAAMPIPLDSLVATTWATPPSARVWPRRSRCPGDSSRPPLVPAATPRMSPAEAVHRGRDAARRRAGPDARCCLGPSPPGNQL